MSTSPWDRYAAAVFGAGAAPRAARELWRVAILAGWFAMIRRLDNPKGRYVTVHVGRRCADPQREGRSWLYRYTWHTHTDGEGRLRTRLARTPDRPENHDGPSLREVHDQIEQNPVTS